MGATGFTIQPADVVKGNDKLNLGFVAALFNACPALEPPDEEQQLALLEIADDDDAGDSREEREKLREISPFHHATSFRAPVLLLHGDDDTVVPPRQSQRMARALRRAGREVEYVELDGEDHWLSRNETRLTMLREISRFLDRHNPIVVSASETGP